MSADGPAASAVEAIIFDLDGVIVDCVLVPNRTIPRAPGTAETAQVVVDRIADLDRDAVAAGAGGLR